MDCRSLCKGVRRGAGERQRLRERADRRGEKSSIFRPAHTVASPLCAIPHLTVIREPTGGTEPDPEGRAVERRVCAEAHAPGVGRDGLQLPVVPAHISRALEGQGDQHCFTEKPQEHPAG